MGTSSHNDKGKDILCQVGDLDLKNSETGFSARVVECRDGNAYLTVIVPVYTLQSFQDFLSSMLSLSRHFKTQLNVQMAMERARSAEFQEMLDKQFQSLTERVLSEFDKQRKKGNTDRHAIRNTRDNLNQRGDNLTCYTVELIVRGTGRLSRKKNRQGVNHAG